MSLKCVYTLLYKSSDVSFSLFSLIFKVNTKHFLL